MVNIVIFFKIFIFDVNKIMDFIWLTEDKIRHEMSGLVTDLVLLKANVIIWTKIDFFFQFLRSLRQHRT